MFVADAVEPRHGVIRGQKWSDGSSVRQLLRKIDVVGRIITADSLHSRPETTTLIVNGGGHVMPVKEGTRKILFEDLE